MNGPGIAQEISGSGLSGWGTVEHPKPERKVRPEVTSSAEGSGQGGSGGGRRRALQGILFDAGALLDSAVTLEKRRPDANRADARFSDQALVRTDRTNKPKPRLEGRCGNPAGPVLSSTHAACTPRCSSQLRDIEALVVRAHPD